MGESERDYKERIRAELVYDSIAQRILRIAQRWRRGRHDAEDLAQAAIVRVLGDEDWKWDPSGGKDFLKHTALIIERLASLERRSYRTTHEVGARPGRDERTADPAPLADEALDGARKRAWIEKVRAELLAELDADDPLAAAVCRAAADDNKRQVVAADFRCSPDDVRFAQARIQRRLAKLLEREHAAELERLRARRAVVTDVAPKGALS